MPPRGWRLRIQDILDAIQRIQDYTRGMTLEAFQQDQKTIDAVIRNLEVIGEAARHIPEDIENMYPDLPWYEMRGMRNILIHEYFGVSIGIVWKTVTNDLPPVVLELREILLDDPTDEEE